MKQLDLDALEEHMIAHAVRDDQVDALITELREARKVVAAVANQEPHEAEGGILGLFCPMCPAYAEYDDVPAPEMVYDEDDAPTEACMDAYDAWREARWERAAAAIKHKDDCAWVIARRLQGEK